ncbi:MAG: hypothetical protein PGMFKBFP_00700 [Anaerolineales bacterium]|nr:hypothetical protein [Anaerolineales bacterium]
MAGAIGAGTSAASRISGMPTANIVKTSRRTSSLRGTRARRRSRLAGGAAIPPSRRTRKMCQTPRTTMGMVKPKRCQV